MQISRRTAVSFRDPMIEASLSSRARPGESTGLVARRTLSRYYNVLGQIQADLQGELDLRAAEWNVLKAATQGRDFGETTPYFLWASIGEYTKKMTRPATDGQSFTPQELNGVDLGGLSSKLRKLSPAQELAVVELLEGWRLNP